jgi:hypothetical protein
MKTTWCIIAVLSVGLGLTSTLRASEEGHPAESSEKAKPTKMPDTLNGIWHEITVQHEQLGQIIKEKKLAKVHVVAFAIRDLAKLLPEKSKDLSPDNQKKLKESVDRIAEIAKRLDQYGDAGDQANTEKEAKRLETLLQFSKKLYPADTFKREGKGGQQPHGASEHK